MNLNLNNELSINSIVDENHKKMENLQSEINAITAQLDIAKNQIENLETNIKRLTTHESVLNKKIETLKAVRTILENTIAGR